MSGPFDAETSPEFVLQHVGVMYGQSPAVADVDLQIPATQVTAFIGPSGCGKTTLLRTLNRMNDLVPQARITGTVLHRGRDLYAPDVDPIAVRRTIGMVFQKPNVFPKSIFDNVAYGPKITKRTGDLAALVEHCLRRAALWDEVKDVLHKPANELSGGQQQRLVIARCLAVGPEVILMDEPCASLDPIATSRIEELIVDLAREYTIVIVTHNMQQATRISDWTAFFSAEVNQAGQRTGHLVEFGATRQIFDAPVHARTQDYIAGRIG